MGTASASSKYFRELDVQIKLNENQLNQLRDLLFIERIRFLFYLIVGALVFAILCGIAFAVVTGNLFNLADRYSALINVGAVLLFFGLIQIFSYFILSLSLIREIRRLIKAQLMALEAAKTEVAAR